MTVRLDKTWWTRTQYRIYHSASVDQELIFLFFLFIPHIVLVLMVAIDRRHGS